MKSKTPASPKPSAPQSPKKPEPGFGWNLYSERINGRFAMVGFVSLVLVEFLTEQNFLTWIGLG